MGYVSACVSLWVEGENRENERKNGKKNERERDGDTDNHTYVYYI